MKKAAVLISGEPRFCTEFDHIINNLKGFDQIDYYFYIWNKSNPHPNYDVIAPSWFNIESAQWAVDKIQSNLPAGHYVAGLELVDQTQFQYPNKPHPGYINPRHIWIMYEGNYGAWKMCKDPGSYDLIIRARPDVLIDKEVDLVEVKNRLEQQPLSIFSGGAHSTNGYGYKINDWVGIGLPSTMRIYCDVINCMEEYANRGITVHGETMLAYHLQDQGVHVHTDLFNAELRHLGQYVNNRYISTFGRWQ